MKNLFVGLWALVWALIVSTLMFSVGILYTLGYALFMTVTLKKKWYHFFQLIWRVIDGIAFAVGNFLYEAAYSLDLAWNVNGEIIEDMVTAKEDTTFSQTDLSVSASIGKLEIDDDLNKFGKKFSKLLNFAFGQKRHAIDAWNYTQAKKALREKYFEKK